MPPRSAARGPRAPAMPPPAGAPHAVLIAVAAIVVVLLASYRVNDYDVWQHLLVGKAIWRLGHVPTTQLWAWPSHGDPEVNSAWLFRAIIYKVWSLGGVWGLYAWRWASQLPAPP